MGRYLAALVFVTCAATAAIADRPVNEEERVKIAAALVAVGCKPGEIEFDDGKFEVDDARCDDGLKYEIDLDTLLKIIKKERDD